MYVQEPSQLAQLRSRLKNEVGELAGAQKLADVREGLWAGFSPPPQPNQTPMPEQEEAAFQKLRALLDSKEKLAEFGTKLDAAFTEIEQTGALDKPKLLGTEKTTTGIAGNQTELEVHPPGQPNFPQVVKFADVLKPAPAAKLHARLRDAFGADVAKRLFDWLSPKLTDLVTLQLDIDKTTEKREEARRIVDPVTQKFPKGEAELAAAGKSIDAETRNLLRREYDQLISSRDISDKLFRSFAIFGMFFALFTLAGFYIYFRSPVLLVDLRKFVRLLVLFVAAVALAMMASGEQLRGEMLPILVFGMTVGIAYNQELALLLTAALSLVVVIALGQDLSAYVILLAASASSILLLGRIRTRSRLIYVGIISGGCCLVNGDRR